MAAQVDHQLPVGGGKINNIKSFSAVHHIHASAAAYQVITFLTQQSIPAPTAKQRIVAVTALQTVVGTVTDQPIIAKTACHIFDHRARHDGQVAWGATKRRKTRLAQIDNRSCGELRHVDPVDPARVPDRAIDHVVSVFQRPPFAARVGIETIARVACKGGFVRTVQDLQRHDIVQHQCRAIWPALKCTGLLATKIAHHCVLKRVFAILCIRLICWRVAGIINVQIISTGMRQPD